VGDSGKTPVGQRKLAYLCSSSVHGQLLVQGSRGPLALAFATRPALNSRRTPATKFPAAERRLIGAEHPGCRASPGLQTARSWGCFGPESRPMCAGLLPDLEVGGGGFDVELDNSKPVQPPFDLTGPAVDSLPFGHQRAASRKQALTTCRAYSAGLMPACRASSAVGSTHSVSCTLLCLHGLRAGSEAAWLPRRLCRFSSGRHPEDGSESRSAQEDASV
jgi:hypothetical protein